MCDGNSLVVTKTGEPFETVKFNSMTIDRPVRVCICPGPAGQTVYVTSLDGWLGTLTM